MLGVGVWQNETKQLLLTAFIKLVNVHPDKVKERVVALLNHHTHTIDAELQQRAIEYLVLSRPDKESMLETVLDVMPNFPVPPSAPCRLVSQQL